MCLLNFHAFVLKGGYIYSVKTMVKIYIDKIKIRSKKLQDTWKKKKSQ